MVRAMPNATESARRLKSPEPDTQRYLVIWEPEASELCLVSRNQRVLTADILFPSRVSGDSVDVAGSWLRDPYLWPVAVSY
jgi:hypothetical protein